MKSIIGIFLLSISQTVNAKTFHSSIHSIEIGHGADTHLVRFDNGRVSFIDHRKGSLLTIMRSVQKNEQLIKVSTDSSNNISTIQILDSKPYIESETAWATKSEPYEPDVLKDTKTALKIFKKMRRDYTKAGECFNRAHIWSVEEFKRSGLKSMKIFMFFTESYIRRYKFHWWFHVTPMVYVKNVKSPRTLDRRYTSAPRRTKTWSDVFVKSKRKCKIVTKFDDFWLNQKSQDCYHIHTSMYYVIPRDIEKRDLTGIEKTEFVEREIKKAYKNAFKKKPRLL